MQFHKRLATRMRTVGELVGFFARSAWWWLTPIILVLILLSALILFAQSSAIAPFIYTLF